MQAHCEPLIFLCCTEIEELTLFWKRFDRTMKRNVLMIFSEPIFPFVVVTQEQSLTSELDGSVDTNYTDIPEDEMPLQEEDDEENTQQKPPLR